MRRAAWVALVIDVLCFVIDLLMPAPHTTAALAGISAAALAVFLLASRRRRW